MQEIELTRQNRQITKLLAQLFNEIEKLEAKTSLSDRTWSIPLKIGRKWDILNVTFYQDTYYLTSRLLGEVSFATKEAVVVGLNMLSGTNQLLKEMLKSLKVAVKAIGKDPLDFHSYVTGALDPKLRYGYMHLRCVQELIPDYLRFEKQLSESEISAAITILGNSNSALVPAMTAGLYFEYCRVAYLANPQSFERVSGEKLDPNLSGQELYKRWADGRSGGLPEIDLTSEEAFREWYHGSAWRGGHPWEIYRGGNSTHIDLGVYWKSEGSVEGWCVFLDALASTRMVETIRIALALHKANLPFFWHERDILLGRLKRDCYIGIVPEDSAISYSWHNFPREPKIRDCIKYEWFRSEETFKPLKSWAKIKKLINWLPLDPMFLKK